MKRKLLGCAFALLALLSGLAMAQEFPSRPIKIIVPLLPGSGIHVAARALTEHLGREFGQPVVVDNRPGGNSLISTDAVARSAPDGHTLLLTTDFHSLNAASGMRLPYDSLKDFVFVSQVSTSPLMLVANPSALLKTLAVTVATRAVTGVKLDAC